MIWEPLPGWERKSTGQWSVCFASRAGADLSRPTGLGPDGDFDSKAFKEWLSSASGFYGLLAESSRYVVAAVDRTRTFPVYYSRQWAFGVSNDARALKRVKGIENRDEESILEFALAGYVGESRTLYEGLCQLLAGEFLVWDKQRQHLEVIRHYLFHSQDRPERDEEDLVQELDALHDSLFDGILERAGQRPIWVPLSGGWDSRLLVSKLVQRGGRNIQTFSYGTAGNHESRLAQRVAALLGVPWFQVDISRKRFHDFFWSQLRKDYFRLSDGLCVLPFVQDIHVISWLRRSGQMPADAVVINGQSGDFITGGHITPAQFSPAADLASLTESLLNRHYNQWVPLMTEANLEIMRQRISGCVANLSTMMSSTTFDGYLAACWEWQERQSKYVVGGQRAYDFCGLDWEMPLWAPEYMDFWQQVPWTHLQGQRLYKNCLRQTGVADVFNAVGTYVWRWPGASLAVVPIARAVGAVMGKQAKDSFYDWCKFMGHYRYSYGAYSPWQCLRLSRSARSANSMITMTWLRENMPGALGGFFDEM